MILAESPQQSLPRPERRSTGRAAVLAHVLVAAWAVLVSVWQLATPDWLVDEVLYARVGRDYLAGELTENLDHPPLAKYLFGLGEALAGGRLGPRLVAVTAGLVTCLALYLLARRVVGWRWALLFALLWASLPHALDAGAAFPVPRLERYAMLDVVAAAFTAVALGVGWRWRQERSFGWAVVTGIAIGCATASKLPGATVGPVVVGAVLAAELSRRTLLQSAAAAGAALSVYALAYAPFGTAALSAATAPVTLQLGHADGGHTVLVAGEVYESAPWWSALHYAWRDDGPLLVVSLTVLAVLAVGWSRDRALPVLLAGAVVVPFALLATSPVALPHYRYLWTGPLLLLATLGLRAAAQRGPALKVIAALCVPGLLLGAAQQVRGLLDVEPGGYAQAACVAEQTGASTAVVRGYGTVLAAEAPELIQVDALPADLLVLDPRTTSRFPADADVAQAEDAGYARLSAGSLQLLVSPSVADRLTDARDCATTPG